MDSAEQVNAAGSVKQCCRGWLPIWRLHVQMPSGYELLKFEASSWTDMNIGMMGSKLNPRVQLIHKDDCFPL